MEPVTHFLAGACLGRSGCNRRTAYATLAMTLAAEAPDLDVFWSMRGPVAGFEHHRGITHTFLGAPFVALAVTGAVWSWHKLRRRAPPIPPRWGLVWFFSLLAVFSHIFLDWTNNYGVRPFFPFDPRWYSLDIAFILEPVIFLSLLLGLAIPGILGLADREIGAPKTRFRGRKWAAGALLLTAFDLGFRAVEHHAGLERLQSGAASSVPAVRVGLEPYPVNPFRWFAIVETKNYYLTGSVNLNGEAEEAGTLKRVVFKPPVTPAVRAAEGSWLGRVFLDWSEFPVVTDRGPANGEGSNDLAPQPLDAAVEFRDLRFSYSVLSRGPASGLTAWVYVAPEQSSGGIPLRPIDAMVMGGSVQRP